MARFRIEGVLGRGGMGVVYRATQLSLGREVALKLVRADLSTDAATGHRFRSEALRHAALEHPNVVGVYDAGESLYGPYIAMRLMHGYDLKRVLLTGELDFERTLAILGGVAGALDAAHRLGLVHRDVKPHNILVVGDEGYLTDFGLSTHAGPRSTVIDGRAGTPAYMSPEQVRGDPPTPLSDIYALGAVLYECVALAPPFPRATEVEVMCAHLYSPPPSVRCAAGGKLARALDLPIRRAMAKRPEDRQRSACDVIAQARAALSRAGADRQERLRRMAGPSRAPALVSRV